MRSSKFTLIAIVLMAFATSLAQTASRNVRVLSPDQPIVREMKDSETHAYLINLRKGEFMNVQVDQRGINVVVSLFAADDRKLAEINNRDMDYGLESLSFVADVAGSYRFEVNAAKETTASGRYSVLLNKPRSITASDRIRVEAERATAEGQRLKMQDIAESYRAALDHYQVGLKGWRELSDRYWEATTLSKIGYVYYSLGERRKALEFCNQALPILREVGDKSGEASTLNNIGVAYNSLGENQNALEFLNQALAIRRAVGDKSGEASTLSSLGLLYQSLGETQKALEFYNQALPIKRAVGDKSGEAAVLNNLGSTYYSLGERQKALEFFNQVLLMNRKAGNKSHEAITLNNIGNAYFSLGERQKALELLNQALLIERAVGNKSGEGNTLNNLGLVYDSLGEKQKALEFLNQALPIERAVGDKSVEATTLNNIGNVYNSLGEKQKALEFYNQALPIERAVGNKSVEATTLNNIGNVYYSLGERQKALEFFNQALPIARAVGDKSMEATTLNNIGSVHYWVGDRQKALEFFNQALLILRAVGDKPMEGVTLNNIGYVYYLLGEKQKALEFYNQALPILRTVGDKLNEAAALNNIGTVYDSLGEKQKALEFYNQALPILRAVGYKSGEAGTLNNVGVVYSSLGQTEKALEFYHQALPISRGVGDKDGEALNLANLMWLSDQQNKPGLAIFYGKQAVNLLQQLRANISGLEKRFQQSFLHSKESTYRKLANILIAHGRLLEAEEVLALLKDEEYASLRRRDDPKSSVGYSPTEVEAVKALSQLGELGREANELRDHQDKKVLDGKGRQRLEQIERELLPRANAHFREALAAIERAPATTIKTAEVREAQSLMRYLRELGPGTVALYTVVSTEEGKSSKGWVILVTPNFRKAYEMDVADLDQTVAVFRQTLRSDTHDPQPSAQKLYRMIFLKPQKEGKTLAVDLEAYLRGQKEKTLMWSLDGVLRYVPMAALHDGEKYLVENYRNVTFTPASLPGLMRETKPEWNVLGLGVSKEFEGFNALAGVPKELSAIVSDDLKRTKGVLQGTIKWDDEFKEKAMMDSLNEDYKVVHIASHFSYEAANPENSFLLLGDGSHLELKKIRDQITLFAKTDLVTLSACDTAVGSAMKDANGKDIEGFAYITQKLGAMAVIASLWPVDDIGTQVLMPKFYAIRKSNPGIAKAEALRQAQLSLLQGSREQTPSEQNSKRAKVISNPDGTSVAQLFKSDPKAPYAHPYYWAPFVLIGNWR